ncbi:hypothetical protein ATO49_23380 [Mycolicibacterium fortuitum subsp. fortuitum DSM 46621 = ATCC 6841 = JCM 6387]|nr:hypothetical protein ATO49_23380 [Mycolicibacterium fortuitum subsp. fortuitum DSM 46621 = ATCC 6841 = JCM 6387]
MYAESEQAGRGAAMTTVVLSFICAGFGYFALMVIVGTGVLVGLFGPADVDRSEFRIPLLGYTAVATALAVAFTVGAMKLLRHNPSGRTIVIVSSALYAAVAVVEFFRRGATRRGVQRAVRGAGVDPHIRLDARNQAVVQTSELLNRSVIVHEFDTAGTAEVDQ